MTTLLLYALGLGAIESGRLSFLRALIETPIIREYRKDELVIGLLPPFCMFQIADTPKHIEGMMRRHAPLNDRLHEKLRPLFQRAIPSDAQYTFVFDKFEILLALAFGSRLGRRPGHYWVPLGAYGYRHDNREKVFAELKKSLESYGDKSPFVVSKLFGDSEGQCLDAIDGFNKFFTNVHWY